MCLDKKCHRAAVGMLGKDSADLKKLVELGKFDDDLRRGQGDRRRFYWMRRE